MLDLSLYQGLIGICCIMFLEVLLVQLEQFVVTMCVFVFSRVHSERQQLVDV